MNEPHDLYILHKLYMYIVVILGIYISVQKVNTLHVKNVIHVSAITIS